MTVSALKTFLKTTAVSELEQTSPEGTTTETTSAQMIQTASGDVNGDGILDISDAIFLARIVAEDTTMDMSNYHEENADVNNDGTINAADTVMILKKIAKLI